MKNKNKGFSLVELLLTLSVVAILMVVAFVMFEKVSAEKSIEEDMTTISSIVYGIDSLYEGKSEYKGLTTNLLFDTGIIPNEKKMEGGAYVKNAWGGRILVNVSMSNGIYSSYRLLDNYVASKSCFEFTNRLYHQFGKKVYSISVDNKTVFSKLGNRAYDKDKVGKYCKDSGNVPVDVYFN